MQSSTYTIHKCVIFPLSDFIDIKTDRLAIVYTPLPLQSALVVCIIHTNYALVDHPLLILLTMSIPNTFNPSDYEYLIRSLSEGSPLAKAETLRRFITLASSDKKQFTLYSKRIVLALQQLICEQKEEINLATSMLILEIINLNPKDIEYYLRTKLLRKIVLNLGDTKPQLRKSSHFCILAYIKTFHTIDEILAIYTEIGLTTAQSQLRQKIINSFQSIAITEPASLNWNSNQFKKMFELLLQKLKDESPYVQKASQQCLLTLSRMEESQTFSKKLTPVYAGLYRIFCETQREIGNLQGLQILGNDKQSASQKNISNPQLVDTHKSQKNLNTAGIHLQKIPGISRQQSINKQALIQRIQEIRRNSQTPKIPQLQNKPQAKNVEENRERADSLLQRLKNNSLLSQKEVGIQQLKKVKTILPLQTVRTKERDPTVEPVRIHPIIMATKSQKVENIFGKKLLQDLRNDKDWKVRLQAIEQLQTKFQIYKEAFEVQGLVKNMVPSLIKLLSDQNFKIVTITLKVLQDLFKISSIPLQTIVPQVVDKLGDGKVSLRQGVARLIRSEYLSQYNPIWLDSLLDLLKRTSNPSLKQEILGIITRLYQDESPKYPIQKLVDSICPMMEDPKTKVKIRTLDLLVLVASSSQRIDAVKTLLISKLNQVYYEMFLQKIGKEMKQRVTPRLVQSQPPPKGQSRTISFPSLRKHNKNSAKNSTSTSLDKYSKTIQTKPLQRAISYSLPKETSVSAISRSPISIDQPFTQRQQSSFTPTQSVRRKPVKSFQRKMQKTLEAKLATTHTIEPQNLRPFSDPEREIKNLLSDLKSQDWQNAYEGLNKFRRLLKHHSQVLATSVVRALSLEVSNLVESLRSSLSKNAVITLGESAKLFPKTLDPELDGIFSKLMRKTLDTNSFISQQVKKTLILIGTHCNQTRVLNCLMNYYTSRAIPIKVNLLNMLQAMIGVPRVIQKEIQKIMLILVAFTNEGAYEIRDKTKSLILRLLEVDKSGKVMRALPAGMLDKLRKKETSQLIPNNQSNISLKEPVPAVQSKIKLSEEKSEVVAKKKKKILVFPKELDQIDEILTSAESSQWKIRQVTITKVAALIKKYPQEITQHKYSTRVIELFAKMSNDPNSKVAISSLTTFAEIIPLIPRLVQANLSVLANEIFNCFASQKTEVRELSLNLFDQISDNIEHWMLVQHLCNGALYGPAKGKGNILVKLIKVLPQAFRQRRSAVQKHLYTFLNKVSEESKGDITPILKQLVKMTVSLGGEQANSSLRQAAKNLLNN